MSIRRLYTILLLCALHVCPLHAQDDESRQLLNEAEEAYQIGKVEEARRLLVSRVQNMSSAQRLRGYRLLTLCYLALEQPEEAKKYAANVLRENPYYSPTVDYPPRFIDMINEIKQGLVNTITTASSQAESLAEVPVPATLITEEMIRNCGGQNLQEVLAAYVPGMNIIDCNNDINIAMRGIYSTGQEKILIMLNGHRLNSYCTNIASPDFSLSLEKIKQIEVLRGPASSLYGGVALTAVVNLITKQGADVDGVKIKGGIGNYGQLRGDFIFGKRYFDLDVLVWGNLYGNKGQMMDPPDYLKEDNFHVPYDTITIGRIGNKPSFDFGVQLKYKDLQLLYDTHFSEAIAPFSMSTIANSYNHDRYRKINGYSPSFASKSHHVDLSYGRKLGNVDLKGTVTYDNSDLIHYQVVSDDPLPQLGAILSINTFDNLSLNPFNNPGLFRFISGTEQNIGGQLKGDYNYINTHNHKGTLTFGAEYSYFQLDDIRYTLGYDFMQLRQELPMISEEGKGQENSYNGFIQLKHKWHSFILNAGLRYDHKRRADGVKLDEFSPRAALILLQPKWNLKLSYSKSFVDAPYMYRKIDQLLPLLVNSSLIKDDLSGIQLSPEFVHSIQLTFSSLQWAKGLNFEINGFYNKADNLIQTHTVEHYNEGINKTVGIEFMGNYRQKNFTADLNLTWIHTISANVTIRQIDSNNNTPAIASNLVLSWKPIPNLNLHSHILFESKQTSYNLDFRKLLTLTSSDKAPTDPSNLGDVKEEKSVEDLMAALGEYLVFSKEMPARAIVNIGAEYQLDRLSFGFNVRNLFNTRYYRSGMNTSLVPQKGCWFIFDVAYKF